MSKTKPKRGVSPHVAIDRVQKWLNVDLPSLASNPSQPASLLSLPSSSSKTPTSSTHLALYSTSATSPYPFPSGFDKDVMKTVMEKESVQLLTGGKSGDKIEERKRAREVAVASVNQAWLVAKQPFMGMLMPCVMMYMSGSQIHIFSMMITYMALSTPVNNMMQISTHFAPFDAKVGALTQDASKGEGRGSSSSSSALVGTNNGPLAGILTSKNGLHPLLLPKLTYLGINILFLCIGLYKLSLLGLIPLTAADWVKLIDSPNLGITQSTNVVAESSHLSFSNIL
eukprot:g1326.t1